MTCLRSLLLVCAMLLSCSTAFAQFTPRIDPPDVDFGPGRISARQAKNHIGENATVCGRVTNIQNPLPGRQSSPTYINLGDPGVGGRYRADFVIVIEAADLVNFPRSPSGWGQLSEYMGQIACATGTIQWMSVDQGNWRLPLIVAHEPTSIALLPSDPTGPIPGQSGVPRPSRCQPWEKEMADGSCVPWRRPYN
jgi:hypothetical protein